MCWERKAIIRYGNQSLVADAIRILRGEKPLLHIGTDIGKSSKDQNAKNSIHIKKIF